MFYLLVWTISLDWCIRSIRFNPRRSLYKNWNMDA